MFTGSRKKAAMIAATIGTVAATYALALGPSVYFATWQLDPGTTLDCDVTDDYHIARDPEIDEVWEHEGPVSFQWLENSEPDEPTKWSHMQAISIDFHGKSPTYGDYHVTLDEDRPLISRIESVTKEDFPAVSTIRFHARLTLDSQPGVVYQTADDSPIVVQNPALDKWPHENTRYDQVGIALFVNPDDDEYPGIELSGASLTTTAQ